ncbi:MAG: hypothetical protein J0H47_07560 [Gammaproteobacteria bacterium]|nr:hypothetical protein [Gammaproteobacteria bacterium]
MQKFFRPLRLQKKEVFASYHWQVLKLFNLYRVALAVGFLAIIHFHIQINFLGSFDEILYQQATLTYLIISLAVLLCSVLFKYQYVWQANIPIFIDIIAIIIIMHASGGLISGVGILLIVIVAAHGLLSPGKLSYLSAATSAIGLFIEQSYTVLVQHIPSYLYPQVGLLSTVIFATSFVTNILSQRARKSQLMVENQAEQLATSQQLNAHIVSAMHAGVLVLDNQQRIRLINMAAKILLGIQNETNIHQLNDLPQKFQYYLNEWQHSGRKFPPEQMTPTTPEIRLSFHTLGNGLPVGTLIFIYNAAEETRYAQDLKLASLGHLTANIAHELRNPLGAASHAAQLLAESKALFNEDQHLVMMIKESCDRMNTVIKNVLSLSGRKPAHTEEIHLIPWLEQFIQSLVIPHIPYPEVTLTYDRKEIVINADPSQLTQILINLCENGLRYSLKQNQRATVHLNVSVAANPPVTYIDVIDQGPGISIAISKHIFEPFFTTENSGSGLGLYIARELSQMNGARLDYFPSERGCQFRITLPQGEVGV